MEHRTRQQRARAAAARLRTLSTEEEARLRSMALPYGIVSLILQSAFVVVAVRTVRAMHRTRHRGPRSVLHAAGAPLAGALLLHLTQITIDRRLRTRVQRLMETPDA